MKACGIIVEYNPMHNGHLYHIQQAKKLSGADTLIAVMSGNFLQRGEPAILDKWTRTEIALRNGVDLVIELPFSSAVQSADYFAKGGVSLLQSLHCESICFGTDGSEALDYEAFGEQHQLKKAKIDALFQQTKNKGMSYPQQMTHVYREVFPEWPLDFSSPNHILGMSYAKENAQYNTPMRIYGIQREGSGYHESDINKAQFASATSIRKAMLDGDSDSIASKVPELTHKGLQEEALVYWEKLWPYLNYQLTSQTPERLAETYQMVEGLEYRILEMMRQGDSFEALVQAIKTKRYTWTRIQRLLCYVLLQVSKEEMEDATKNAYIRVLGFNDQGRQYLGHHKKNISSPIITNVNKKNENMLQLDIRAGRIYRLSDRAIEEQDYYRSPIYLKE